MGLGTIEREVHIDAPPEVAFESAALGNSNLVVFDHEPAGSGTLLRMAESRFHERGWYEATVAAKYIEHAAAWDFFLPVTRQAVAKHLVVLDGVGGLVPAVTVGREKQVRVDQAQLTRASPSSPTSALPGTPVCSASSASQRRSSAARTRTTRPGRISRGEHGAGQPASQILPEIQTATEIDDADISALRTERDFT